MGTAGLIIQAQSREEILADKFVALAFRPNRIKNRDLWDIVWLKQHGISLPLQFIARKVADHNRDLEEFFELLEERVSLLSTDQQLMKDFAFEMRRFLPAEQLSVIDNPEFWTVLKDLITAEAKEIATFFKY
jgi:hypothetical protein